MVPRAWEVRRKPAHAGAPILYTNGTEPAAYRGMVTSSDISKRIIEAVLAQKLAPGARLGEQPLAMLFDCSRTIVREALMRLAARGIVTVSARRGWYVIEPSEDEAREAFEARRVIETGLIRSATTIDIEHTRYLVAVARWRRLLPMVVLVDDRAFIKLFHEQETRHIKALPITELVRQLALEGARVHVVTKATSPLAGLAAGLERGVNGDG